MRFSSRKLTSRQTGGGKTIKIGGRRFSQRRASLRKVIKGGFVRAGSRILAGGKRKSKKSRRSSRKNRRSMKGGFVRDNIMMTTRQAEMR